MSNTNTKQFRVVFTQPTIQGDAQFSSRWFDSIEEAQESRWMREDNAKIETRTNAAEQFPWKHYLRTALKA